MTERKVERPTRKPWKVTVSLFPEEWNALRAWCEYRGVSGGELVAAVLSHWLVLNPPPAMEPPSDPDPEDA